MAISRKTVLATMAGAALLAGCVTDPYYDGYGYDRYGYDRPGYGYDGPAYYGYPGYVAPSIGFGFTYSDRDDRRGWRGDHRDRDWQRDGRDGRRDGRGDRGGGDRGGARDPGYSGG
jgi:hypothetical protein